VKLQTSSLRSKVARRIFLLFVTCALVPIGALTILAFYTVSGQLRSQQKKQLEQTTKSHGMSTFERLEMLNTELQVIAFQILRSEPILGRDQPGHFRSITTANSSEFSKDQLNHLRSGKALLTLTPCSEPERRCIQMVRLIDQADTKKGTVAGTINPQYLWSAEHIAAGLMLCVFDAKSEPLLCSKQQIRPALQQTLTSRPSSGFFDWNDQKGNYDTAYWSLFLKSQFHSESWIFTFSQAHSDAVVPMERFRNSFPFVVLLALWIVILLSLVQIRRTMVPLERLKDGTRKIREHNFDSRVEVTSRDEFEELANSFNSMSGQLGRQFRALKTIQDIDETILESLDRNGIIGGVLNHMPSLIPADLFLVAVFDGDLSECELVFPGERARRTTLLHTSLSDRDVSLIKRYPKWFQINEAAKIPDFLDPLRQRGMSSLLVLPIYLEGKPFAALVCGVSGSSKLEDEDFQDARRVADQLAVAFSNVQLIEALEQFHWGTLTALARAIDAKSAWTAGHSERVTALALRIAKAMGLKGKDLQVMQRGGLLHDIGKIGTPPQVLDKAGKLDPVELQTMRDHVRIGLRILEPIPAFREALPIVAQHHEWFNGQGYPAGLAGEAISLHARIFAVADCYDALISDRPYRPGLPKERVVEMVKEGAATQFDPKVVEAFLLVYTQDEKQVLSPMEELRDVSRMKGETACAAKS
jgi:putative nucleotidyltransferase with HDIG domain